MELKYYQQVNRLYRQLTFNRTAYGIEMFYYSGNSSCDGDTFNRTAYGIEIGFLFATRAAELSLLIAPLMELKLLYGYCVDNTYKLLIAPLMELKFNNNIR